MKRVALRRKGYIKRAGKRTKRWEAARRKLKKAFERDGVIRCELNLPGCRGDDWLGFAHSVKRRYMDDSRLYEVALLCSSCHLYADTLPHEGMEKLIKGIIEARLTERLWQDGTL